MHADPTPTPSSPSPSALARVRHGLALCTVCTSALLAACATPGSTPGGAAPFDSAALQRLDRTVEHDITQGRLPGAVMLVWRDGRVVHQSALGRRTPDGPPMTADSIFRIYSMTKPVVSVAVMQLVEEGKVQLDDPVERYLPEFKNLSLGIEKKDASGRPVLERVPSPRAPTVQDLMRHTAGLTYGVFGQSALKTEYLKAGVEHGRLSNTEFSQRIATLPLAYVPGTTWEYSRATDVLGALVERVSGQPLGQHLQQRIFGPLQMKDSGFHVPAEQLARVAEPFPKDPDTGQAVRLIDVSKPPVFESGGGGLVSTAADYLRFCRMLLAGGTLDGVRVLSRHSVDLMRSDHLGADVIKASRVPGATTGYLPGPGYGFGLGFAVRLGPGEATAAGSTGDYSWSGFGGTSFWIDPQENLIAIWMSQAPHQREHYRMLFRNMVYAAL
ncbi:beta-lactamase family protein [Aquabacterium sp. A7-Y]|uniref:serine hydrolase domain-containing protein n=1 Tax=Aquabacterium sp. A7-Y TaxID=1349605 RepID=UPI00223CAA89|nr:serine hydrolase domain-containing protein [Aquabacterium sp. A7-Y]MCW7539203.1 beta-lactamase family protein [Aquabacterium sp. A7-Y]